MASGDFFDTDTHTGSFHDSGGSFGGFSSGSGSDYGYSDSYGGGSGSGRPLGFMDIFQLLIFFCIFLIEAVYGGLIPGYNIANFVLFLIAFIIFVPSMKERKRFTAIRQIIKNKPLSSHQSVWSSDYSDHRVGDEHTWYGRFDKNYSISFYDEEHGEDNKKACRETVKRTSRIIWLSPVTWLTFAIISAVCNFFFYELVIPVFERARLTDQAFFFFDFLIEFLPSMLAITFAVLSLVFIKVKDGLLYKCAVRIVADNQAKDHKKLIERNIDRKLSKKWYYNNCPNCGALADYALKSCKHCGTSLEVDSFKTGAPGAVHRLTLAEDTKPVKEAKKEKEYHWIKP